MTNRRAFSPSVMIEGSAATTSACRCRVSPGPRAASPTPGSGPTEGIRGVDTPGPPGDLPGVDASGTGVRVGGVGARPTVGAYGRPAPAGVTAGTAGGGLACSEGVGTSASRTAGAPVRVQAGAWVGTATSGGEGAGRPDGAGPIVACGTPTATCGTPTDTPGVATATSGVGGEGVVKGVSPTAAGDDTPAVFSSTKAGRAGGLSPAGGSCVPRPPKGTAGDWAFGVGAGYGLTDGRVGGEYEDGPPGVGRAEQVGQHPPGEPHQPHGGGRGHAQPDEPVATLRHVSPPIHQTRRSVIRRQKVTIGDPPHVNCRGRAVSNNFLNS